MKNRMFVICSNIFLPGIILNKNTVAQEDCLTYRGTPLKRCTTYHHCLKILEDGTENL